MSASNTAVSPYAPPLVTGVIPNSYRKLTRGEVIESTDLFRDHNGFAHFWLPRNYPHGAACVDVGENYNPSFHRPTVRLALGPGYPEPESTEGFEEVKTGEIKLGDLLVWRDGATEWADGLIGDDIGDDIGRYQCYRHTSRWDASTSDEPSSDELGGLGGDVVELPEGTTELSELGDAVVESGDLTPVPIGDDEIQWEPVFDVAPSFVGKNYPWGGCPVIVRRDPVPAARYKIELEVDKQTARTLAFLCGMVGGATDDPSFCVREAFNRLHDALRDAGAGPDGVEFESLHSMIYLKPRTDGSLHVSVKVSTI